jgi:hypothetical protein
MLAIQLDRIGKNNVARLTDCRDKAESVPISTVQCLFSLCSRGKDPEARDFELMSVDRDPA